MSDVSDRPGARLASRPLHFIWLIDCSESMGDKGKIDALNQAVATALGALDDAARTNPHAQVLVRALAFSTGVRWVIRDPTPPERARWVDVQAAGYTELGAALKEVASVLHVPPMEARALPPALVLVSDGRPTDDFTMGLRALMAEPWGQRAVRLAIGIGTDADHEVLQKFIGHPEIRPLSASNPAELLHFLRWASTVAARVASQVSGQRAEILQRPDPPPTPAAPSTSAAPDLPLTW